MKNLKKIKNIKNKDQINQWIIIKIILQRIIRLKKNYQIRAMPNNNEDSTNNLKDLKLKIKDLQETIEKKDKIIQNLETEKNKYKNKYHAYKDKIKKMENNELQNLKNIIKFDKNKLIIGNNTNFTLLSNKNEENTEKTKNKEIEELKNKIKSQNEEMEN